MESDKLLKRVAIFLPSLLGGGTEQVMVTLANGMAERGIAVDMVVGWPDGPNRVRLSDKVNLVVLGEKRASRCVLPLARYFRAVQPDAMLSAMTYANNVAIVARLISRSRARLVISERTSLSFTPVNRSEAVHMWLRRWTYRYADKVVLVAKKERSDAAKKFGLPLDRVVSVYNPIITPEFERERSAPPEHPWLADQSRAGGPVIVAVGRLDPVKNYPMLIDAFALLRTQRPARLIIFGEGAERDALSAQVKALALTDSISLPGFVRNLPKEINAADLFVLSSKVEGLPGALIQALGCGLRIVSTDCETGPREILDGGKWGTLVPIDDTAALVQAMATALAAPPRPPAVEWTSQFSLARAVDAYLTWLTG